jgi:hypothetical protein
MTYESQCVKLAKKASVTAAAIAELVADYGKMQRVYRDLVSWQEIAALETARIVLREIEASADQQEQDNNQCRVP